MTPKRLERKLNSVWTLNIESLPQQNIENHATFTSSVKYCIIAVLIIDIINRQVVKEWNIYLKDFLWIQNGPT